MDKNVANESRWRNRHKLFPVKISSYTYKILYLPSPAVSPVPTLTVVKVPSVDTRGGVVMIGVVALVVVVLASSGVVVVDGGAVVGRAVHTPFCGALVVVGDCNVFSVSLSLSFSHPPTPTLPLSFSFSPSLSLHPLSLTLPPSLPLSSPSPVTHSLWSTHTAQLLHHTAYSV